MTKFITRKELLEFFMLRGNTSILVHSDGCVLPEYLSGVVQLQLGPHLKRPIKDLKLGDLALTGTFSFGMNPFPCTIPWSQVGAIFSDDGLNLIQWGEYIDKAPKKEPVKRGKPGLRIVK